MCALCPPFNLELLRQPHLSTVILALIPFVCLLVFVLSTLIPRMQCYKSCYSCLCTAFHSKI